jgi:hypothetical protein
MRRLFSKRKENEMKNKMFLSLVVGLTLLLSLASCGGTSKEITVTFKGNLCTYDGPKELSSPRITFDWLIDDPSNSSFTIVTVQIEEGKTNEDLIALPLADPPSLLQVSWLRVITTFQSIEQGTHQKVRDLSQSANFQPGPIYFVCFNNNGKIGTLGPIEVK